MAHQNPPYLAFCTPGHKGQEARKDVTNCETKQDKHQNQNDNGSNKQKHFEETKHQLEICTECLAPHGHYLQFQTQERHQLVNRIVINLKHGKALTHYEPPDH